MPAQRYQWFDSQLSKIELNDDRDLVCQDEIVAAHCPIMCEFCCEAVRMIGIFIYYK